MLPMWMLRCADWRVCRFWNSKRKLFVPYTDEEKKAIQERNEEKKRKSEDVLKKVLSDPASFEAIAKEQSEDPGSKE